ncbi:hypothetical protein ACIBF6_35050 [Streptosporangium amethystogenes]|uniref:hypothetical protein n=1 Tax=Streptosporangium amethystogenes TaxID=2002 RepID=UPI0037905470
MRHEAPVRTKTLLYGLLCVPFVFPTWWMVTSPFKPVSEIFAFPLRPLPTDWDTSA